MSGRVLQLYHKLYVPNTIINHLPIFGETNTKQANFFAINQGLKMEPLYDESSGLQLVRNSLSADVAKNI